MRKEQDMYLNFRNEYQQNVWGACDTRNIVRMKDEGVAPVQELQGITCDS